jgi:hypothetical protein
MDISKFDVSTARIIAANLYIARRLNVQPARMIKFIICNREYFPDITDEIINSIKKEKNITDDDIAKESEVKFAEIHAESKFEDDLMQKAEKIDKIRKEERTKRDYGHGIKNRMETNTPSNVYNGLNESVNGLNESVNGRESVNESP